MRKELQSGWDCAFIRMHRGRREGVERGAGRTEIMVYRRVMGVVLEIKMYMY